MLIRCAFFEGRVRDGKEAAFEDSVQQQLLPLWRRFPGSTGVAFCAMSRLIRRRRRST